MAGEEIRLGPFVGGLNTFSDPTAIGDTDLAEVQNFEMEADGSLVNRPPFVPTVSMPAGSSGTGARLLGYYSEPGGIYRLIGTSRAATYWFNGTAWNLLANFEASAVVQYRDDLWLITDPTSSSTGGKWTPSGGFVADPNIPQGRAIIAHKERLWVAPGRLAATNGTRLYMSTIVSAGVNWPASKVFINVGAGDGQNIVDLVVYNTDIVIFKTDSTYRFAFSADPATGIVSRISPTIGCADIGCYAEYENQIYVLHNNKVYIFINYNFEQLNSKVPLKADSPSATLIEPYSLSVWADRLIVQYYDKLFVYSLRTQTWSVWKSSLTNLAFPGRFYTIPGQRTDQPSAYLASPQLGNRALFQITDAITTDAEDMECYFWTKNYDYQSASKFKKLFWWGVDLIANVAVTLTIRPVESSQTITWGQAAAYKWSELQTWSRPISGTTEFVDNVPVEGVAYGRKFIKSPKALRFRQIAFKVSGKTRGDVATSPLAVFNVTTYVRDKQTVANKIS